MSDNRRRFLGTMGAAAIGGGVFPRIAHAALPQIDHPAAISDRYDVAWADKITGRFRAVFDSPNMAEGAAIVRATAWCDQYMEIYGVARAAMNPVLVLRADAIELIMDDTYWGRFPVGEEHKFKGRDSGWLTVNPISAQSRASATDTQRRNTLETFMKEGGVILACSWAFGKVTQRYRSGDKLEVADAAKQARAHIIPGIVMQPNGIFAVLRAQEAGCHFVAAS
ncbi:hypothetical protein [Gemmatimonas sp.]|uniref:hypothetical protein n=1 Tax=Gemmatimonas sp. TaxID=1962908 RepID=UPI0035687919